MHVQRNNKKCIEATLQLKTLYFSFFFFTVLSLSPFWFLFVLFQLAKGELRVEDYSATYGSSSCTFHFIVLVSFMMYNYNRKKVRMWFAVEVAVFISLLYTQLIFIFLPVFK
jgi:hypothetical protein